ncbi:MAG: DUF58 domain-containing protein [Planctomycetota bacterium]
MANADAWLLTFISTVADHSALRRYQIQLTRLGFHFLFVALFAIVGGSMRGFNLLLLLAGLLMGTLIVNWRQTRYAVRVARASRVACRRPGDSGAFVGEPLSIRYEIRNASWFQSLWSIRLVDPLVDERRSDDFHADDAETMFVPIVTSIGHVPPKQSSGVVAQICFHQRGKYSLGPLSISTTFPFSLVKSSQTVFGSSSQRFAYPAPLKTRRGWQRLLPRRSGADGRRSTGATHHDGEFFGLRPWRSGDQIKQIHWRTTARLSEPAVRQFEQRHQYRLCIIIDAVTSRDTRNGSSVNRSDHFEILLRIASTMIDKLASNTNPLAMLMTGTNNRPTLIRQSDRHSGHGVETTLLQQLATAELSDRCTDDCDTAASAGGDPLLDALTRQASSLQDYDWMVISGRSLAEVCERCDSRFDVNTSESGRDQLLRFHRLGRMSWLDLHSPSTQRFFQLPNSVEDRRPQNSHPAS